MAVCELEEQRSPMSAYLKQSESVAYVRDIATDDEDSFRRKGVHFLAQAAYAVGPTCRTRWIIVADFRVAHTSLVCFAATPLPLPNPSRCRKP